MTTVDSAALLVEGPWRHRFVAANGSRFHVAVAGPDDHDAPLVVLLHPVPLFWWTWRHHLPLLAAAGYRVAALDMRGCGGSDKPPQGYDVPTLARDVAGVIRALGAERAVVVGSGTGGEIAWAMAAYEPGVLRGIGAFAAPHPLDARRTPDGGVRARALPLLAYVQLPALPERSLADGDLLARLLGEWGAAPGWPDARTLATYRQAVCVPFAAHSQLEHLRWLARSALRPEGGRYLARLRDTVPVPVLQVHGTRDGLRPASRAPLRPGTAALVGEYRFELVPRAGHFLPEEAPERTAQLLLAWLARVAPVDA